MQRFVNLGVIGEGSYGMVFKCLHKASGQLVAVKKVLEIETDDTVRKIAVREIRMLRLLQHDNLVRLIEVFRELRELFLVFEFVDHTLLDELDRCTRGLEEDMCRKFLWQVLQGTHFIHSRNVVHRDIKPENILVSDKGIVKICDFGFARTLAVKGEIYTDYVATRWYRAPELLVGDIKYGRAVDIWAIGCLVPEMLTGEPMFPGDSDIDQLYLILECCGRLTKRHKEVFQRNPLFIGMRLPVVRETVKLEDVMDATVSAEALLLTKQCLEINPDNRPTCNDLLKHDLFKRDGFHKYFPLELKQLFREQKMPLDSKASLTAGENVNESCKPRCVQPGVLRRKKAEFEKKYNRQVSRDKTSKPKCTSVKQGSFPFSHIFASSWRDSNKKAGEDLPACVGSKIVDRNKSHSNSSELQPFTNCDSLDLEKDVRYFLSPLLCQVHGNSVKFHTQAKNKDVLEVCGFSRPPQNHHSNTPYLQQQLSVMNPPQRRCMEKPHYSSLSSLDGFTEKQPSVILPDVNGANAATKHSR